MKDLYDLSAEISGISMILKGLSNQVDNDKTDSLTPQSLEMALFGVSEHLGRIASDLENLQ